MAGGASNIKAGGAYVEIFGETGALRSALGRAARMVRGFVASVRTAARGVVSATRVMARAFTAVGRAIAGAARRIKDLAATTVRRTVFALSAALGAATNEAIKFQTAMAEVWSIMNVSRGVAEKLAVDVRAIAVEFGQAPVETARALYQTISAGVTNAADALFTLRVASKAAVAGLTSTFAAVDALTTVINSYGLAVSDATKISDMMFTAVREGKTTFAELSNTVGTVTALASQAGVKFQELMAAVATLTKGGIRTDLAMTSLRQTIVSIINPGAEASKLAKKLGIDFSAFGLKVEGLVGLLQRVRRAVGGNVEAMTTLFPNIRALSGVMSLAGSQSAEFARQLQNMENSSGATEKAFGKMANTARFKLAQAWAKIRDVAITIGRMAMPFVVEGAARLARAFEMLQRWTRRNWSAIQTTIRTVLEWASKKLAAFRDFLQGVFSGKITVGAMFQTISEAIAGFLLDAISVLEAALPYFANYGSRLLGAMLEAFTKPREGGMSLAERIVNLVLDAIEEVGIAIEENAEALGKGIWQGINAVLEWVLTHEEEIKEFGRSIMTILSTVFTTEDEAGLTLLDKMKTLLTDILGFLAQEVLAPAIELGKAIGRAIIAGIGSAIQQAGGGILDWLEKHAPGFEAVKEWMEGLQGGPLLGPGEAGFVPGLGERITSESLQQAVETGAAPAVGGGPSAQIVVNNLYKQGPLDVQEIERTASRLHSRGRVVAGFQRVRR